MKLKIRSINICKSNRLQMFIVICDALLGVPATTGGWDCGSRRGGYARNDESMAFAQVDGSVAPLRQAKKERTVILWNNDPDVIPDFTNRDI